MTIVAKQPSKLYVIGAADYERCFEEMPEVTLVTVSYRYRRSAHSSSDPTLSVRLAPA